MPASSAPRILISRLSHIGDCILTIPILAGLRRRWPNAYIAWLVERPSHQLLEDHPAIDKTIVLNRGWMKSPDSVRRLQCMVRSHRFDVSIDPQSLTKSAILPWLARIPVRIGFARGVGRELAPILNNHKVQPRTSHVIDRTMELLKPLGIENRQVHFQMPMHPAADEKIVTFLRQARLADRFAVLNPGAGWPSRVWPAQRYADVARFLAQECNLASVVVWAGDQEREWANTIVAGSTGKTTLAPRTNLRELAALLARATLFVGSDTGPLHLAVAVGTRCVSMFGPTRPKHSGPYGKQHVALQQFYQAGTSRQRRGGDNLAMRAIQVDVVCSACEQVLSDELAPAVDQAA